MLGASLSPPRSSAPRLSTPVRIWIRRACWISLRRRRLTSPRVCPPSGLASCRPFRRSRIAGTLSRGMRMIVGGAAAPESMIRAFDKHDLRVIHAWGMTETTPLGSVANLKPELLSVSEDEQYAYRAKQGVPSPLVDVRAVGDEGEVAWDGESLGELHVRGPWVAGDYFNQPEARGQWTDDGWFRTGDVVAIDEHGYIRIADRTKDLVKSGGEWISSQALENALIGHDAVAEAAVIGVPHPKWQERPLAVVVLAAGSAALEEELKEMLAEKFASWWVPEAMVFAAEIPKTSTGKFQKSKLREQYQDWTWD